MTSYTHRRNRGYKPSWDKGNGWMETKAEWQDFDKAVDKTVTKEELKELWCPASGSTITVKTDIEGLTFDLDVGPKEYNLDSGRKRKPTAYGVTYRSGSAVIYYPYIPLPNASRESLESGAWHKKFSWSAAVKELLKNIIPAYEKEGEAMCLRAVASEQVGQVPELPESGEDEAPAA